MSIKVAVRHSTSYEFDKPVTASPHIVRLRPAPHTRTPISSYSLNIEPANHFINWQQDPFGNYQARLIFPDRISSLKIDVEVIADMVVINPFDFFLEDSAQKFPFQYSKEEKHELLPYLVRSETDTIHKWLENIKLTKTPTIDFLVDINQRLEQEIDYNIRMEAGVQTCTETLRKKSGSCRDSAWLLVQILRHLGLASRFVSGYLVQLTADTKSLDGPSGPEEDFTDLHAWTEVYLPGAGWVGMDPTSGLFAGEGHIPLACSPNFTSASPVTGAVDKCETKFDFSNTVTRIHEDPRVTKPYEEKTWENILKLGNDVEAKLEQENVRLTMGGEPTFVSIDDMDGAEWNTEALGEKKLQLSEELFDRLYNIFADKGLKHVGQGKWYPGEPLPRWALSLYWRKDGEPLWHDKNLFADGSKPNHHTIDHAKSFIEKLTKLLELNEDFIHPGFEDVYYYLWSENKLPSNVDPFDSKLDDPIERARLKKVFEQGLDSTVGYALPLRPRVLLDNSIRWESSQWKFRDDRMYLIPGDSPMGFRLPLESIFWLKKDDREMHIDKDPSVTSKSNLDDPYKRLQKRWSFIEQYPQGKYENIFDITQNQYLTNPNSHIVYTALCAEIRNEQLHIFLPPLPSLETAIELISAIELTASELKCPVVIEGYPLPSDDRLEMLQITPDPGVIEVNIHPSKDWNSLVEKTEILYEQARLTRLGTEKFMLDGRHSGTGGGNHVTLGGHTTADSPFLRRPELLGSLLRYWQNHPSLSYLFSGLFIGPTSQAPRVDEARDDSLYELEIALENLPKGEYGLPWVTDRVLRNCLVDLTGNTHRTEFCIDKLYSPDSSSGRRGLLELRAFEMPPHSRMSSVQMLLIRALVARFWNKPYQKPLIHWGTTLHDRYMLPHFVWEDFKQVIDEMQTDGFDFEIDWFDSFYEFRFPQIGSLHKNDVQLQLRTGIEPWHVLGEEATGAGMSRYVDSSIERVEIKVSGLFGERYAIACNGRRLPLRPTDVSGEYVAGVRFKAWNPPSSLHPTIQNHDPLVFDIIDTHNNHSIGGCTYFVSHAGGRNSELFPVNANEAESRRVARFATHGHHQNEIKLTPETAHPTHPVTLDLRHKPFLYF